ncbi:MAG TPA: GspMb/PilO family protein [Gemmatimonas sp.]|nr:GspMb/PilO family protein [Gemmatimonas sp.]
MIGSSALASGSVNPRTTRERLVVRGGAAIVTVALLFTYVVLPYLRTWGARELELRDARAQTSELAVLAASANALDSAATAAEQRLAERGRRVFRARSTTLAASALQSYLQDASDASGLAVTRLDVATDDTPGETSDGAGSTRFVPATLSANCDIHGLAGLLAQFATGPRVVHVTRMTVQMNSALRGAPDMLQVTLSLRAPVIVE